MTQYVITATYYDNHYDDISGVVFWGPYASYDEAYKAMLRVRDERDDDGWYDVAELKQA